MVLAFTGGSGFACWRVQGAQDPARMRLVPECLLVLETFESGCMVTQDASASSVETAAAAVARFEPNAAAALLEEEIREAIVGTVGSAVGMAPTSRERLHAGLHDLALNYKFVQH